MADEADKFAKQLTDILNDPIPYGKIKQIPEIIKKIDDQIQNVLREKKENAKEKIKVDYDYIALKAKQYGVSD